MAIILGPELDVFLRGIGEDLKGRTRLDEPHVDKKTIIRAVSEQNKVLLTIQERILQMQQLEQGMQRKLESLQEKVDCFEHYTKKVDVIENILDEKMPLLNKINRVVQHHDSTIDSIVKKLETQTAMLSDFKSTTKSAILDANVAIEKTSLEVERMPEAIIISSGQVKHSTDTSSSDETLDDLIVRHENESFMQEENFKRMEERVERDASLQNTKNIKVEQSVKDLLDWRTEQKNVDLAILRENQDSTQAKLVDHETILANKMSKRDVDTKLESQFNTIVEHLQSALSAVDNDEAEFKSVTDSLSKMCESLREKKADKVELTVLRKELISSCANASMPLGGSTVDNETIRRTLASYPSKEFVMNQLSGKLDKDKAIPHFERMNSAMSEMQELVHNILHSKDSQEPSKWTNQTNFTSKLKSAGLKRDNDVDEQKSPSNISPLSVIAPLDAQTFDLVSVAKEGISNEVKERNSFDDTSSKLHSSNIKKIQCFDENDDIEHQEITELSVSSHGPIHHKRDSLDALSKSHSSRVESIQGFEKDDIDHYEIRDISVSRQGPRMSQKRGALDVMSNSNSSRAESVQYSERNNIDHHEITELSVLRKGPMHQKNVTESAGKSLPTSQGPFHEELIDEEVKQIKNELTERSLTSKMEIYHELDERFPSSSAMKGPLSNVPHKQMDYNSLSFSSQSGLVQGKPLRPPSSNRPKSAVDKAGAKRKKRSKKMSTFPAILTSITKTMKPRSKQKVKNRIHKGSYQVIHKTIPIIDQKDSSEQDIVTRNANKNEAQGRIITKEKVSRNQDRTIIRTSIE